MPLDAAGRGTGSFCKNSRPILPADIEEMPLMHAGLHQRGGNRMPAIS